MKILVAEDEEILARVVREKLEKKQFSVQVASDGESVLPMAKSFHPNIIILDIILPKKNGIEVLRELKGDPNLKDVPVIMLSNLGEDEDIKTALKLGALDYFVKAQHPLNEIVEKINQYLIRGH